MSAGEALKKMREAKGLSMQELAEKIGVNKTTIFKWEHGVTPFGKMSAYNREKLAQSLGISTDMLRKIEAADPSEDMPDFLFLDRDHLAIIEAKNKSKQKSKLIGRPDTVMLYALDVMAGVNGYRIDHTSEGDIILTDGMTRRELTEEELAKMLEHVSDFTEFMLRNVLSGGEL